VFPRAGSHLKTLSALSPNLKCDQEFSHGLQLSVMPMISVATCMEKASNFANAAKDPEL